MDVVVDDYVSSLWVLWYIFIDFFLFNFVEKITESYLAKTDESIKKQTIWVWQAVTLFAISAVIHVHHTPYFLMSMASFSMIYAFLLHKRHNGKYWQTWQTRYKMVCKCIDLLRRHNGCLPEHPIHGTIVANGVTQHSVQDQVDVSPIISVQLSNTVTAGASPDPVPEEAVSIADGIAVALSASVSSRMQNSGTSCQLPRPQPINANMDASRITFVGAPTSTTKSDAEQRTRDSATMSVSKDLPTSDSSLPTTITPSFKQQSKRDTSIPPGLVNYNQENLCFMNCIFQTLSRSPQLGKSIEMAISPSNTRNVSPERLNFLKEVVLVFTNLTVPDEVTPKQHIFNRNTVDSRLLRKLIRESCKLLFVEDPSSHIPQSQHDAAEFLLQFLDALHTSVHVQSAPRLFTRSVNHSQKCQVPRSTLKTSVQVSLDNLRAEYNNPMPITIDALKMRCHADLAEANGQDKETYFRHVKKLADLDWLAHQNRSNSAVNDLFTGQLVSACFCVGCNHISVTTDTFRVLRLQIPSGCDVVPIEACFEQLVKVENLPAEQCPAIQSCTCQHKTDFLTSSPGIETRPSINSISQEQHMTTPFTASVPMSKNASCQRRTSLQRLADCLVIKLLRFSWLNNRDIKLGTRVKVSISEMDLSSLFLFRLTTDRFIYSLYGVCMHSDGSSAESGHYSSFALADDGHWYLFDDATVTRVDIDHELNKVDIQEKVYILYYRKIQ